MLRDVLLAAAVCGEQLGLMQSAVFQEAVRISLANRLQRISNCIARSKTSRRRQLDQKIAAFLQSIDLDVDLPAAFFAILETWFETQLPSEPAKTALAAIGVASLSGDRHIASALEDVHPTVRACSLDVFSMTPGLPSEGLALTVFKGLGEAVGKALDVPNRRSPKVCYVRIAALCWYANGLRPSRVTRQDKVYQSVFHRFVDLVLTAVVEPHSNRHFADLQSRRNQIAKHFADIPADHRGGVGKRLRQSDEQWLISDNDVKVALASVKKRRHQTP
jgi:hypothetical protein